MPFIVAWAKYEPIVALPPKCSWEDEGDELPELPEWKALSPLPSPAKESAPSEASSVQSEYALCHFSCASAFTVHTMLLPPLSV